MPRFLMLLHDVYELSSSFRISTLAWKLLISHANEIILSVLPRTTGHQLITYFKWNKRTCRRWECIIHSY